MREISSDIRCLARAEPIVKGSNRQLIILDGSENNGKALAAVLIISGLNNEIHKAEDFNINVELKLEGNNCVKSYACAWVVQ